MTIDLSGGGVSRRAVVRASAWTLPAVAVVAAAPAHAASGPGSSVQVTGDLRWFEILGDAGYYVGFLDPVAPDVDSDHGLVVNSGSPLDGPASLVVTVSTPAPVGPDDQMVAFAPGVLAATDDPASDVAGGRQLVVPFVDGVPGGSTDLIFVASLLDVAARPTRVTFSVLVGADVVGTSVFDAPVAFDPLDPGDLT